ncbi:MAG: ABC transporter permease [Solirubrobacteraceae bacterium]|jgi:ribose/xylose/arabinose/galactoside ABC-type transport system permease subunit
MSVLAETEPGAVQRRRLNLDDRWMISLVILLVAELLYFNLGVGSFWGGGWGSATSFLGEGESFLYGSMVALGVMFVIFTGDIDLSVGYMASFAGVMMAEFHLGGMDIWVASVLSIVLCGLIGVLQGLVITYFKLESLLVTLAGGFILNSGAVAWEGAVPPYGFPTSYTSALGTGNISSTIQIPNQLIIFAVLAVIATLLVHRTRFGRQLVLVGHNRQAAAYAGVRVSVTRIRAFALSATFGGIAGMCLAANYGTARDDLGPVLLLPAIACVVLGGVDIFGGSGRVPGVIIATFIIGWLTPGLLDDGVNDTWVLMAPGILLLAALTIKGIADRGQGASFSERLRERFGGAPAPSPPPAAESEPRAT